MFTFFLLRLLHAAVSVRLSVRGCLARKLEAEVRSFAAHQSFPEAETK